MTLDIDVTLARGLNYYTGCIFVVNDNTIILLIRRLVPFILICIDQRLKRNDTYIYQGLSGEDFQGLPNNYYPVVIYHMTSICAISSTTLS